MKLQTLPFIRWLLRISVSAIFLSHGLVALLEADELLPYFSAVGIGEQFAVVLLPLIGLMDLMIALSVVWRPYEPILWFASFWGLFTSIVGIVSGAPLLHFLEHIPAWVLPIALLLMLQYPKKTRLR